MLSQSEKILRSFKSKQKSLCQLATTELYPKETKKRVAARKRQKCVWVWCLTLVVFGLSNHADLFFLAWCSLTAQENGAFERFTNEFERIKKNEGRNVQQRLLALSIRCIKSDKLNFNEFLDDLVMKARTKPFTVLCSALIDSIVEVFCTYFNNDSIREVSTSPVATREHWWAQSPQI